jgi:DNA-binding transcriptional LysR family regulator
MQHESLSLKDFELVRAIGASGNLTCAAKLLALDHSSAFRRLASIEQRVGTALFRRSRRGYAPTDAGELVIAGAQRILADAERLHRELSGRDARAEGRLRITIPDTLAGLAAQLCAAFVAQYPSIRCDLVVANAFVDLERRDADVALRACAAMPDGLSSKRLAAIATAIYAPQHDPHPGSHREGAWIGFDDALAHLSSAQWLGAHVAEDRIVMRVNSLPAALAACQAGLGRTLLPCYFGDAAGGLRRVSEPLEEVRTTLWFATHPDLRRSAKVRLLREFAQRWLPERIA